MIAFSGPSRPRFTLRWLFKAMLLASVVFAVFGGIVREAAHSDSDMLLVFLMMAVAAPVGLMIVLSLIRPAASVLDFFRRRDR